MPAALQRKGEGKGSPSAGRAKGIFSPCVSRDEGTGVVAVGLRLRHGASRHTLISGLARAPSSPGMPFVPVPWSHTPLCGRNVPKGWSRIRDGLYYAGHQSRPGSKKSAFSSRKRGESVPQRAVTGAMGAPAAPSETGYSPSWLITSSPFALQCR